MLTFSAPEMRAGVEAAAHRNTYAAVTPFRPPPSAGRSTPGTRASSMVT